MMKRYLKLLFLLPIAVVIVALAVSNRTAVRLVYWPEQLGGELGLTLPLFAALMLALMAGVIIGGLATWLTQGSHRRAERQYRREAERLKSEAERLKAMQPSAGELALPMLKSS
jgi:uncharacterized integral membrane protein